MAEMLVVSTVSRSLALQSPVSWNLAKDRGVDLTFAAAEDAWTPGLERLGSFVPLRASRTPGPASMARLAGDLRRLARTRPWDLVQVQTPIVAALWRCVAPARLRRQTVYVAHGLHFQPGDRSTASMAYRAVEALLAHRCHGVATVAAADAQWLETLPASLRPTRTWRLPGAGVEVARFRGASASPRLLPAPYALFCGDLNTNKDPLFCVAVVDRVRHRRPDLSLVVIGEGPLRRTLDEAARSRPWMRVVDRTGEMERWVAGAAVLLAPSRREGVPRTILEALAAGTPVVARTNRGSEELLCDGVGEMLPVGATVNHWADRVESALNRPAPVAAMAERAARYDVAPFSEAYGRLLDDLLGVRSEREVRSGPPGSDSNRSFDVRRPAPC